MNISLENIDKVSAVLTIKMEKADYADRVEKALKDFREKQVCRVSVRDKCPWDC